MMQKVPGSSDRYFSCRDRKAGDFLLAVVISASKVQEVEQVLIVELFRLSALVMPEGRR